jgi:hypothetical protein
MSTSIQQKQRLAARFAARRRALELEEIKARGRGKGQRSDEVTVSDQLFKKIERVERLRYRVSADELEAIVREIKAEQAQRIRTPSTTRH